jgi:hypothetical protein
MGLAVSDWLREDPLTMTRRHVLEAEGHVARQEALVAKLDRDGHAALADEAREFLATLKTSLELAREHLSTELKMRSQNPDSSN